MINSITLASGRVRLVCATCGKKSTPRRSTGLFDLPQTWAKTPLPDEFEHTDGSVGSRYTCAQCLQRS